MNRKDHQTEVATWEEDSCSDCGGPFPRRGPYERLCPLCYKVDKGYNVLWGDQAFLWAQDEVQELRLQLKEAQQALKTAEGAKPVTAAPIGLRGGLLRQAILLCHPDKHKGSEVATRVTQLLLALRARQPKKKRTKK